MRLIGRHICLVAGLALCGMSAHAQERDVVHLHARFLDTPTQWCPADKGVPIVETMDGPDVKGFIPRERNHFVRIRRGTSGLNDDEQTKDDAFYKTQSPASSGRFHAKANICFSLYGSDGSGEWEVRDGSKIISKGVFQTGDIQRTNMKRWRSPVPYFEYNRVHYFELDDEVIFFAASSVETKRTTEAFASPAKGITP